MQQIIYSSTSNYVTIALFFHSSLIEAQMKMICCITTGILNDYIYLIDIDVYHKCSFVNFLIKYNKENDVMDLMNDLCKRNSEKYLVVLF